MSPSSSCSVPPKLTRFESGRVKLPTQRLVGDEHADGHLAVHHLVAAEHEHGRRRQRADEDRRPWSRLGEQRELPARRRATWPGSPPSAAKNSGSEPVALSVSIIVRPFIAVPISLPLSCSRRRLASVRGAGHQLDGGDVERRDAHHREGERHVVEQHQHEVEDHHEQVDGRGGELAEPMTSATLSLMATREPISPAKRWPK